jgi:hypothetical protein
MMFPEARPFLSIVGFKTQFALAENELSASLAKLDPARRYSVKAFCSNDRKLSGLLVDVEGVQFTVMWQPDLLNVGQYASAIAAASLTWPSARTGLSAAGAQLILSANQDAGDHQAAVKVAYLLTILAEGLMKRGEAAFLYWGTADLLVEPRAFLAAAERMRRENEAPVLQWVRFDLIRGPQKGGAPTGGMRSRGLASLVGLELQLDPVAMAPVEIAKRAIGFAEHLVREGPVNPAVDIDGPVPGERIHLVHDRGPGGEMLRMTVAEPA